MCETRVQHKAATQNAGYEAHTETQHLKRSESERRCVAGVSKIHTQLRRRGMNEKNARDPVNTFFMLVSCWNDKIWDMLG